MVNNPDVLFIGDSHIPALKQGALENGLQVASVQVSGRFWHKRKVRYGRRGLVSPPNFPGFEDIQNLKEVYGVRDVVDIDAPIITTAGYHLGALASPLSWRQHLGYGADFPVNEDHIILSRQFIEQYIAYHRQPIFDMLVKWSENSEVLIVPPPKIKHVANFTYLRDVIMETQRSLGLRVYDPADDLGDEDGLIPDDLLAEDKVHGSDRYGQLVMKKIIEKNLLSLPSVDGKTKSN